MLIVPPILVPSCRFLPRAQIRLCSSFGLIGYSLSLREESVILMKRWDMPALLFVLIALFAGYSPRTVNAAEGRKDGEKLHELAAKLIRELTNRNEKASKTAAEELEKIAPEVFDLLLRTLKNGDSKTRAKIVQVLGSMRLAAIRNRELENADGIEEIVLEALRDSDHDVINSAAAVLTYHQPRSKKAIPLLIAIMRDPEKTYGARSAALVGLQNFGPDAAEAIPVLLDRLANSVEYKIDPRAFPTQEQFFAAVDSSKKYVWGDRYEICRTLVTIGPKDQRVSIAFNKAQWDPKEDIDFRMGMSGFMVRMGGETAQAALPDILYFLEMLPEEYHDARRGLIRDLGMLKLSEKEIPILIFAANSEDYGLRREAIEALDRAAPVAQAAWLPLLHLLQDKHDNLGPELIELIHALGAIEPPNDVDRAALAREVSATFDRMLRENRFYAQRTGLLDEMKKTLAKLQSAQPMK